MKECCDVEATNKAFGKILWVALALNLIMFFVEVYFGLQSQSSSLKADSLDFLGDAFNYGLSIVVLSLSTRVKARASQLKAITMITFGIWIVVDGIRNYFLQVLPEHNIMTSVGIAAFFVNLFVAILLFKYRKGESQMQSVWVCTRNDIIGNVAVLFAALGVSYFNSGIPDLIVALFMAVLVIVSGFTIFRVARKEIIEFKTV